MQPVALVTGTPCTAGGVGPGRPNDRFRGWPDPGMELEPALDACARMSVCTRKEKKHYVSAIASAFASAESRYGA
eukprot:405641-Pelagomonas_calceolata.AAC.3